jgi:GTP cyclohydrolase I
MGKEDRVLGQKVHEFLKNQGVETPILQEMHMDVARIVDAGTRKMLEAFGLDMRDDSLKGTPDRVGKMYTFELFYGLDYRNFPKCTTTSNKFSYDEMVTVRKIPILSMCEHHLMPIDGYATISYIPDEEVLGLSKFNRLCDFFARRPQVQERLTEQIWYSLAFVLNTTNIAVKIDANHYCMKFRGVKSENSITTTTKLGGVFKGASERAEFLNQ